MKNVPGDVSHSSFSIPSMFRSSISSHLTKFWLDRIGGCWVLVVAFRWWVSVVELNRWPALVVGFFRCLLGFGCGVESVADFGGWFFSVFVGSIWWWVLVLAGSVWWLGFVMVFLVVGFRW